MSKFSNVWEFRKWLGTKPHSDPVEETKFYRGVEDIKVSLVDWPVNPYKAMFSIATATWGGVWEMDKWSSISPEARFQVVNAVLHRKSLPNAMEAPSFTFEVAGPSRSSFDQIARARIGAVFGSMGWRDNNHSDIGFRVPEGTYNDPARLERFKKGRLQDKRDYVDELATGQSNWQDARAVLPISALHRWSMAMNFMALSNFMAKRLHFNEQADTVATAWLMRYELEKKFPLLAMFCRPSSDWARKCVEHVGDEMSQAFGCLFKCSGRWPCTTIDDKMYSFNTSCSDREVMMKQTGLYIPKGDEGMPSMDMEFSSLRPSDKILFE